MRPKKFDQEAVVKRAMHLFWEKGFEGTSLQTLQQVMGLSRASIYNTFRSKDELYTEALQLYLRQIDTAYDQQLNSSSSPKMALKNLLEFVAFSPRPKGLRGCFLVLGAMEMGQLGRENARMVLAGQKKLQHRIAQKLSGTDKEIMGILICALHGLNVMHKLGGPREQREAAIRNVLQLLH